MDNKGPTVEQLYEEMPERSIDRLLYGAGDLHRDIAANYDEAMQRFPFLKKMHTEMQKVATQGNIANASRISGMMNVFLFLYSKWKTKRDTDSLWEGISIVDDANPQSLDEAIEDGTVKSILDYQMLLDNKKKFNQG